MESKIPIDLLEGIWDDISNDEETLILDIQDYEIGDLKNTLYDILDDPIKRHNVFRQNMVKGQYKNLESIRAHRTLLAESEEIKVLIDKSFKHPKFITSIDCLFLNVWYRKLLRAKLESYYKEKEILDTDIFTNKDDITNAHIITTLRLIKIICRFLNIPSTYEPTSFSADKIDNLMFWQSISEKFVDIFGENRINLIADGISNITQTGVKSTPTEVLLVLSNILYYWSGSVLLVSNDRTSLNIIPATFVTRLIHQLF
jgi:hypothetical protein